MYHIKSTFHMGLSGNLATTVRQPRPPGGKFRCNILNFAAGRSKDLMNITQGSHLLFSTRFSFT